MALTLNGTTGLSGIVGSAGTPALQGSDTNTGYFFGTDTLGLSTGGTQRLQIDSSGNIKLGSGSTQTLAIKDYGYSGTYKNVMIGSPGSNVGSVGICVDVSTISGGNFAAQHQAILGKNGFLMPNNAGDNFIGVLRRDSSADKLYIGPGISSGLTSGPLTLETSYVGIGTTAPQRNLHIHQPSESSAYLHLTNSTTGSATTDGFSLYVATDGQTYYRARENTSTHRFYTGTTEKLHIDYSGRLGIGVTPKTWHSNNKAIIQGLGGYAILARSNNLLGIFQNFYYDSNDAGKYIEDGEATAYFQNDGNHIFYTAASGTGDASASFSEVLKLQADKNVKITDGDLVIGTEGHGINFSVVTPSGGSVDSNTLADYEVGEFTPTWYTESSLVTVNYHTQKGFYVKIGRIVYFQFYIRVADSNAISGGSGNLVLQGLPFTSQNATSHPNVAYGALSIAYTNNWQGTQLDRGLVSSGATKAYMYVGTNSGTNVNAGAGNLDDGTQVRGNGSYVAADYT